MPATSAYRSSLDWLFAQTRGGAPRDPDRMKRLADALALDLELPGALIVGTNGKGTVTSMIAAGASAAGIRSGTFISPHVEEFRERISVDGVRIPEESVVHFVDTVRSRRLPLVPSFFELTLAMALAHFSGAGVDFAAFEAGVGARRDATAALQGITVSAITPIALDHLETLGPTLLDIARDKSAAIRTGKDAVSSAQAVPAAQVLRAAALDAGAHLVFDDGSNELFRLPSGLHVADPVRTQNARLAAAALRLLGGVPEQAVATGVSIPPLPGRAERFEVDGVRVLLDGAHDPAAAEALARRAAGPYVLLFGSLRRKQGEKTLASLEGAARAVVITSAGGEPTTVTPAQGRLFVPDPAQAFAHALHLCRPGELLVIAGSLYLAGALRPLLRDRARVDAPLPWSPVNREAR